MHAHKVFISYESVLHEYEEIAIRCYNDNIAYSVAQVVTRIGQKRDNNARVVQKIDERIILYYY
jgi:hypothetical protein